MAQIPYTLSWKIGNPNRMKLSMVYLRYHAKGMDILIPSKIRIERAQFDNGNIKKPVKGHPLKDNYNQSLNTLRLEVENRIISTNDPITEGILKGESKEKTGTFIEYIEDYIFYHKGKLSDGRIEHYNGIISDIKPFDKKVLLSEVNATWLLKFEQHLRTHTKGRGIDKEVSQNTILKKMKVTKAVLNFAIRHRDIQRENIEGYKMPAYTQSLPEYLTENEIAGFKKITDTINNANAKTCGYYFLLSCYTGFRISDLMAFDYGQRVRDSTIVLRANKNGKIVSIPIYSKLQEVLEYCKDNKIAVSEQELREQVKTIANLSGITGRNIKVHSGRHTFAMLMLTKGLTIDEVSELLGDSKDVAKVYARITNVHLQSRVLKIMSD